MKSNIDDLVKLAEIARKKDKGTTNALLISALKPQKREKVAKILTLSAIPSLVAMQDNPFWEFPLEEEIEKGDISIGHVLEGNKIGFNISLPLSIFTEHIGIFGQSGSGKSFLCKYLASQLIKKRIPTWFFDFENEYSDLFIESPNDFYILDSDDMKINLFQNPPNTKPIEWFEKLMNVLRESLYLRDGSINMIGEFLYQQYKMRGILEGQKNYPALKDIHREINKVKFRVNSRNAGYWETLNNRCTDLVKLPMFDCKQGLDFPMLMKKSVVFKLGGLSDYHQNLFVNYMLTYISCYRERTDDEDLLVLLLDEGHRIINLEKAKRADLGEPIAFEAARNFRKRGVSLVLSDQVPSLIPASWMGNLGTRLVMRLSHGGCIRSISDALALEREQRVFMTELPRRCMILHYIGWPKPVLIRIPELSFRKIDRNRIEEFMSERNKELKYVPYEEETIVIESKDDKKEKMDNATKIDKRDGRVQLLKEEMDYLESINREPFLAFTERDKKLEISGWKGNRLRKKITDKGIIEKVVINTGKKGGIINLIRITKKGREIADSLGMRANNKAGKGGFTHQFWQHTIAEYFDEHSEASSSIENDSLGKAVDVDLIFQDKKRVAVEICINDNESFNASKDLDVGYDEVWVCCENEEMIKKVERKIKKNLGNEGEKVKFRLLSEFYNSKRNIKESIGAQPCGLRAEIEEKAKKEENERRSESGGKREEKERKIPKNINKNKKYEEDDLLTIKEAASILSMSISTIRKWVARRRIPVVKLGSGIRASVRIRKGDLDDWIGKKMEHQTEDLPITKSKNRSKKRTIRDFKDFIDELKSETKSNDGENQ